MIKYFYRRKLPLENQALSSRFREKFKRKKVTITRCVFAQISVQRERQVLDLPAFFLPFRLLFLVLHGEDNHRPKSYPLPLLVPKREDVLLLHPPMPPCAFGGFALLL